MIIDGKASAAQIRAQLAEQIKARLGAKSKPPGLATVLVGEDPASAVYVRNKIKACQEVGISTFDHHLATTAQEQELLNVMTGLERDERVHGILVQLPLPPQINATKVFETMPAAKDVDGFGIANWGRFFQAKQTKELEGCFVPCTPWGVMKLLEFAKVSVEGKFACVLGRSNIVGKPMAHLLTLANATVALCHSKTQNLPLLLRQADIIVAAMGQAHFLTQDMVREGAVVIDVGINRLASGKLAGDVDFESVSSKAAAITPVPGGVGPMTIAMLLANTIKAWEKIERLGEEIARLRY